MTYVNFYTNKITSAAIAVEINLLGRVIVLERWYEGSGVGCRVANDSVHVVSCARDLRSTIKQGSVQYCVSVELK